MAWVLEDYFRKYRFVGMADYLGLGRRSTQATEPEAIQSDVVSSLERRRPVLHVSSAVESHVASGVLNAHRTPVSIIVPCFNEELILPYLANTLRSVETALKSNYELHFIFVDDGSSDRTSQALQHLFGAWPNCAFLHHEKNLGVAASILDGIRHAGTEIVCSIDCDCTYDPHELRNMIPMLAEGVCLVTASPYHPQGRVRNVPHWRLSLSKGASFLYRHVLRNKLFTYTSCFRVYRRYTVVDLRLRESGFLGIAEMLGRLDLYGAKIVEYPTMLEVRLFGHSKMKVLRTVGGHLRLLTRLLAMRVRAGSSSRPSPAEVVLMPDATQGQLRKSEH
jgi:glycosyltransferase involved in cell wall biosynthesis